MNAEVTPEAHAAWKTYVAAHGVSFKGLMQAIADAKAFESLGIPEEVFEAARKMDIEGRDRS